MRGRATETNAAQPEPSASGQGPTRLLVPLDGSEEARAALPYTMALATPGTEIVLLTVVPVASDVTGRQGQTLLPADRLAAAQENQARAALERTAQGLRDLGYTARGEVVVGDPADRIIATATAIDAAIIVMASHGRGAVGRLLFGSVADRVARGATVPVMIVRAGRVEPGPVGITRLVAPLDGSSLAEEALPVATAISRQLGTSIVLVEAVNPAALIPPTVGAGALIPAEIYDETADALEQEAQAYLAAVAGRLREQGLPVATRVLTGPPAPAIMDAVALGDVIVLCSHGRSGVQRWLLGSVAEQLVRSARVPVILVPAAERARMAS